MPTYKVSATITSYAYLEVEADSEEEAIAIAEDTDGGEFTAAPDSLSGWDIDPEAELVSVAGTPSPEYDHPDCVPGNNIEVDVSTARPHTYTISGSHGSFEVDALGYPLPGSLTEDDEYKYVTRINIPEYQGYCREHNVDLQYGADIDILNVGYWYVLGDKNGYEQPDTTARQLSREYAGSIKV